MNRVNYILTGITVAFLAFWPVSLQAASARINYLLYCTGCHGVSGEGSPPNVPTLVGELGKMIMVPEMRDYLVQIPGAASAPIDDMELTAVITWCRLVPLHPNPLPACKFNALEVQHRAERRELRFG